MRVYQYIVEYMRENGIAPSQREIAENAYIARSSVVRYLDVLAERSLIIRGDGVARGIGLPKCDDCTCDGVISLNAIKVNR